MPHNELSTGGAPHPGIRTGVEPLKPPLNLALSTIPGSGKSAFRGFLVVQPASGPGKAAAHAGLFGGPQSRQPVAMPWVDRGYRYQCASAGCFSSKGGSKPMPEEARRCRRCGEVMPRVVCEHAEIRREGTYSWGQRYRVCAKCSAHLQWEEPRG